LPTNPLHLNSEIEHDLEEELTVKKIIVKAKLKDFPKIIISEKNIAGFHIFLSHLGYFQNRQKKKTTLLSQVSFFPRLFILVFRISRIDINIYECKMNIGNARKCI